MRNPNDVMKDIVDLTNELEACKEELAEVSKGYLQCRSCNRFFKEGDLTISNHYETRVETVFVDAGYGDDDRIADVTRLHEVIVCPHCGKEISHKSTYLYSQNERPTHI